MTIYNLHLPAETATRCELLLDMVQPHAVNEQLECSFLLSVASMLLCQTNDKIRKPEYTDDSIAESKAAFMKALTTKLSALANDARRPLNVCAATSHWGCIRRYKPSITEFARGPEEVLDRQPSAPCAGADWQTGSLFKHLRNGIAHGCVWWGPEPKLSRCGVQSDHRIGKPISLIFIMSRFEGQECKCHDSAFCEDGKSTITWQATRFTVETFEACLRYWCDLLHIHGIPATEASDLLAAA